MIALIPLAILLAPILVWLIWRSQGYKRQLLDHPPSMEWVPTPEAFIDPSSGEAAQVWVHPRSGDRAYVRKIR